ncbi:MAG: right-handed parallel beta-helix repeat-containing protein [Candidatus Eisenbacteria bacterium]
MLVDSVDATHVWVLYNEQTDLTVPINTTLVAITRPATVYSDPYAQVPLGSSQTTVGSTGRATFFLKDSRADALVTGSGFSTRIYPFLAGGYRAGNSSWLNAKDFPTIQDAVNAVPIGGGTVFIPAGVYGPSSLPAFEPPLVLPYDRPIRILGEGREITTLQYRFVDVPGSFDPSLDLVQMTGHFQTIEDLSLRGGVSPLAEGHGSTIRIWRTRDVANDDGLIFGAAVRRVAIFDSPGFGIKIDDAIRENVVQCSVWASYDDILIQNCGLGGAYVGLRTTTQSFRNCNFRSMGGLYPVQNPSVRASGSSGLSFRDCIFDDLGGVAISLADANNVLIDHCWFEGRLEQGTPNVDASGTYTGLRIASCVFINNIATQGSKDHLLALRATGLGRGLVISDAVIWLNFGNGANATGPNIEVISSAPELPRNEVTVIGGTLRDSTGLHTAPHCLLRTHDGNAISASLGSAWRSRVPSLTTVERDSVGDWNAGDLIFNSDVPVAQMYDGSFWRNLWP